MIVKKAEFIKSMRQKKDYLESDLPEIAVAGRSNAGKSSLINCITNNGKLARVSGTPGKTRLVNFFLLNEEYLLVDLPGYGYAKVAKSEQGEWERMVSSYFDVSQNLKAVLVLMDIRHKPTQLDKHMLYFAQRSCVPFVIVATKADKVARSKRKAQLNMILKELGIQAGVEIVAFSSLDRTGKEELLEIMGRYYYTESQE